MKLSFSLGRAIALTVGLFIVFIFWGLIFSSGGSGSNVLLGVMLAFACVYFIVINLGPYIDGFFFHGGSRKKGMKIYNANRSLSEWKVRLDEIMAKRRSRKKYPEEALKKAGESLDKLGFAISNLKEKRSDLSNIDEQISSVDNALEATEAEMKSLLGKAFTRHFFSGWDSLLLALIAALALRAFIVEPYQIPSGSMIPTLLVGDHLFVSKLRYGIINPFTSEPSYFVKWSDPEPGDVVIFLAPYYVGSHAGQTWIKRAIAKAGQTVRIENSVVFVDGKPYKHVTPEVRVDYLDYFGAGSSGWFFNDDGVWREQSAMDTVERISENVKHQIYMRLPNQRLPFETRWPAPLQEKLHGLTCNSTTCTVQEGYVFVMGDNRGNSSDGRVWGAVPLQNIKGKAQFIWLSVEGHKDWVKFGRFVLPEFRWSRWFRPIK